MTLGVVAALAFSACSGGDNDNDAADATVGDAIDAGAAFDAEPSADAAPELTPLEAFCAPEGPYDSLLSRLSECGGFFATFEINGTDLVRGEALSQICNDQFGPMIASGTVEVSEAALASCLSYATTTSCEELSLGNLIGTPCEAVFVGTVADGGDCETTEQCLGDAYCAPTAEECGSCTARLPVGNVCDSDQECSDGLCNSANQCAAPATTGESCVNDGDCVGLLVCDKGTCASDLPVAGDPCNSQQDCSGPGGSGIPFDIGLYCAPSMDKGPGSCTAAPAVGEACIPQEIFAFGFDLQQDVCNVINYEWCDGGTCAQPATSALGEPCNIFAVTGSGARRCESGLICSNVLGGIEGPQGLCQTPGYEGDTCDLPGDGPPTQPCSPAYECQDGTCSANGPYEGICPAP